MVGTAPMHVFPCTSGGTALIHVFPCTSGGTALIHVLRIFYIVYISILMELACFHFSGPDFGLVEEAIFN